MKVILQSLQEQPFRLGLCKQCLLCIHEKRAICDLWVNSAAAVWFYHAPDCVWLRYCNHRLKMWIANDIFCLFVFQELSSLELILTNISVLWIIFFYLFILHNHSFPSLLSLFFLLPWPPPPSPPPLSLFRRGMASYGSPESMTYQGSSFPLQQGRERHPKIGTRFQRASSRIRDRSWSHC